MPLKRESKAEDLGAPQDWIRVLTRLAVWPQASPSALYTPISLSLKWRYTTLTRWDCCKDLKDPIWSLLARRSFPVMVRVMLLGLTLHVDERKGSYQVSRTLPWIARVRKAESIQTGRARPLLQHIFCLTALDNVLIF